LDALTVTINDKSITAIRFPAYVAREVMRISAQEFEINKRRAELVQQREALEQIKSEGAALNPDVTAAIYEIGDKIYETEQDIAARKAWVVAEIYHVSVDDVEHSLSVGEIDEQVKSIYMASKGIFEKNA
jgi:hypothetical protein